MKTRTKRILLSLAGALLIGVCGIAALGYYFLSPTSPRNRAATIETIRKWGRLAPFPESSKGLSITTEGSMFTRGFRASFTAPAADIERWLEQSPGTKGATPTTPSPGVRRFEMTPGGGAQWAELTVDDTEHRVSVYVYWS